MLEQSNESKISFSNKISINENKTFLEHSTKSIFKFCITNNSFNNCKICDICGASFQNKFNKERHIRNIHEKYNTFKMTENNDEHSNMFKINKNLNTQNDMGLCDYSEIEKNTKEKIVQNNNLIIEEQNNFLFLNNNANKPKANLLNTKNNDIPYANDKTGTNDISWLIKSNKYNFYEIFKKYNHIPLKNYFLFIDLVIGQGKFGTVWFGIDASKSNLVAIKSENKAELTSIIEFEIEIMNKLEKFEIFSKFYDKIEFFDRIFLVETLHGPTVEKLWNFCGRKFSVKTIYKIGIELIHCLKFFHSCGFLYLDLKCDNISILLNKKNIEGYEINLTLIDYGFTEKYADDNGNHFSKEESPKVHGNIYFSSINALSKSAVSRKDDMLSLCYLLIDLYLGSLPWLNICSSNDKVKKIIELKSIYTPKILCGNCLKEVVKIFDKINDLDFEDIPNYNEYIEILNNGLKANKNKTEKSKFDWEKNFKKLIGKNSDIENLVQNNVLIKELFEGYPESIVIDFLRKYKN